MRQIQKGEIPQERKVGAPLSTSPLRTLHFSHFPPSPGKEWISKLTQFLSNNLFCQILLTAAHNALRAQVRSEGGVRIQRSASILAAAFIFLLSGGEKYLKDGRLVLKLSSTPWLTLTPALTYPSYQWLTLNFFHSPRVSPIRLSTQAQCLLSPALSFENIR